MGAGRWAWAAIDLGAVRHNVGVLRRHVAPAAVWAVVKADGYGHGAVAVGEAALDAGAGGLCVALVDEGVALRRAGITAPVLLLSEQPVDAIAAIVDHGLTPTVYTRQWIDALAAHLAVRRATGTDVDVHLKVDTGMQRVGADPGDVAELVAAIAGHPGIRLAGMMTHLAVADVPSDPMTDRQLERLDAVLAGLPAGDESLLVHAANSAGGLAHPRARRSLVRAGIAIYGIQPGPDVAGLCAELRPALSLKARVSFVKRVRAGTRISYGLRHQFDRDTTVATIPIGYADGVPRRLSEQGGAVLVGGRRCPIVGVLTMDQLMVDVGDVGDGVVSTGDEVVLIGSQGGECVRAEEWAARLGTIGYEVVCGISARVPRVFWS